MASADKHSRNGHLSVNEIRTFLRGGPYESFAGWLTGGGAGRGNFSRFDKNKDGWIDLVELEEAVLDYLIEQEGRDSRSPLEEFALRRQKSGKVSENATPAALREVTPEVKTGFYVQMMRMSPKERAKELGGMSNAALSCCLALMPEEGRALCLSSLTVQQRMAVMMLIEQDEKATAKAKGYLGFHQYSSMKAR